ncbi:LuxR C-terminal-related transcriptional regulator [Pseudomonas sp. G.S.17]|uniref:response regulator transcription factor n=1 Tax=Pseudomonas sp. G.S.17 TaxID=3137451 RepID=UPI00311CD3DE
MNATTLTCGPLQGDTGFLATQELRTALAICAGLANKEIAKEMDCAPGTVKKTVERLFYKMGVSSRAALVAEAFKRGLISFSCAATQGPQHHHEQDQHAGVLIA